MIGQSMHPAPTQTVLLVDDQPLVRKGIRAVLQEYEDVQIVGEARDGGEAIQYTRMLRPHVVLMDISMPQIDASSRISIPRSPDIYVWGLAGTVKSHSAAGGAHHQRDPAPVLSDNLASSISIRQYFLLRR